MKQTGLVIVCRQVASVKLWARCQDSLWGMLVGLVQAGWLLAWEGACCHVSL